MRASAKLYALGKSEGEGAHVWWIGSIIAAHSELFYTLA